MTNAQALAPNLASTLADTTNRHRVAGQRCLAPQPRASLDEPEGGASATAEVCLQPTGSREMTEILCERVDSRLSLDGWTEAPSTSGEPVQAPDMLERLGSASILAATALDEVAPSRDNEHGEQLLNQVLSTSLPSETSVPSLKKRVVIFEAPGGSDKGVDGYRKDTIPIVNALHELGWEADVVFYTEDRRESIYKHTLLSADSYVHRINPGNLKNEEGYFSMLKDLIAHGVVPLPHPDAMTQYGAKDALSKLKGTKYALPCTQAYYSVAELHATFPRMLATGERVLKQNRGSTGEGIWRVQLEEPATGDVVPLDAWVKCWEAKDNHMERHTLGGFMKFCEKYLVGDNAHVIDQKFLPRIVEGEVRVLMMNKTPVSVVHKKPADSADAFSATLFSGSTYRYDEPEQWSHLVEPFLAELPNIRARLGNLEAMPFIWTADFILGPVDEHGEDTYVLGEMNCSCIGFTNQLELAPRVAEEIINMTTEQKTAQHRANVDRLEAIFEASGADLGSSMCSASALV